MPTDVYQVQGGGQPLGYEDRTVSDSAVPFSDSQRNAAHRALVTVEDGGIRFRVDGGDPTATSGHLAEVGDQVVLKDGKQIKNFRAIRANETDATLRVTYLG